MPLSLISALADLPDTLVEQFDAGDGLLWIGAGVSRRQQVQSLDGSTAWAGVPAAASLEAHLRAWTPGPHPQGAGLEDLATIYVQRFDRGRLNRLLRAAYLIGARVAPQFYDQVARLPASVRLFVTTNYDPFLERALASRQPSVVVVEQQLEDVSHRRPVIYKVHGDAASPDTCVITTPDYDRWERRAAQLKEKLSTLFIEHTVVALGYSAQDGNFRRLLGTVNARVRARAGSPRSLFVVTPDAALENFAAYDVPEHEVVLVRTTGEEFLGWLRTQLNDRQRAAEADALSRLIDAPLVRNARDRARALLPTSDPGFAAPADVPDGLWIAYAEALLVLADRLWESHRSEESIRTRADASRALRVAGADARADAVALEAYTAALARRDARLADDLWRRMTFPVTGELLVRPPGNAEIAFLAGLADVLTGEVGAPPALLAMLDAELDTPVLCTAAPSRMKGNAEKRVPVSTDGSAKSELGGDVRRRGIGEPDEARLRYCAARLRAEHAVTSLDFLKAASCFDEAAKHASSVEERAKCCVRAALFSGLLGGASGSLARAGARATLQAMVVPETIEPLRLRADSWLAALDGELAFAAESFVQAGRRALAELDAAGAAGAYRSAEWAIRQRPDIIWMEDNPGALAYRLESSIACQPNAQRVSAHELREEAEGRLRTGNIREAWLAALAAQRLAYDDIDPGNVYRAQVVLAEVWERAVAAGGDALTDAFSLYSTVYYSLRAHSELDDDRRKQRVEVLGRVLATHAGTAMRDELVACIATSAVSRAERVSALMLLADLAPALSAEEVDRVGLPLLRAGIADGWAVSKMTNGALAACSLLGEVLERLTPEAAAVIRDDLARLEEGTPPSFRDDLYVALARATDRADALPGGGASLARQLLATLNTLRATSAGGSRRFRDELGMALAAVTQRAAPDVANQIGQELEREAAEGYRQGIAVLAVRNVAVPQTLLDDYLRELISSMRGLTCPADKASFGMGPSDDPRLSQRAGADASPEVRHAAIDAVIELLGEDRQREIIRAPWVTCAMRLGLGTPERRADIAAALLRLATGAFVPSGCEMPFGYHALSGIRVTGLDAGALQANALRVLGALWSYATGDEHSRIREALETALLHSDPVIREGAVRGTASTVTFAPDWNAAAMPRTAGWQVECLVRTLADPLPSVRFAAQESLVALARPHAQ